MGSILSENLSKYEIKSVAQHEPPYRCQRTQCWKTKFYSSEAIMSLACILFFGPGQVQNSKIPQFHNSTIPDFPRLKSRFEQ